MRAVIQRVKQAQVCVNNDEEVGHINQGLVVFLGVAPQDQTEQIVKLVHKLVHLRIFTDNQGKMNLDLTQIQGSVLAISQFTLYGEMNRGNRPSFTGAAKFEQAHDLYHRFLQELDKQQVPYSSGRFGADMTITAVNDGPVTLIWEDE